MISCWHVFLFLWLTTSSFAEAVNACVVHVQPTTTVAVVGERVSLNCTVTSGACSIGSWQLGTDVKTKTVVYSVPQYGRNGTVTRKQTVDDGYSVTNTADHKTTSLLINQINISQSGLYVCQCDDISRSSATTPVVVLASEPKISVISSIVTSGKPVSFFCNISFNGSADISSNLTINDISGTTFNRTVCYSNNHLTSCSVGHTTIADPSVDQSYNCSVQLIANNTTIYSRIFNTSLEWKQVTGAEIVMSSPNECSAEKCVVGVGDRIICRPKTEGNLGMISYKWWQIQLNGSKLEIGDGNQTLVLTKIGNFTYQCQAYDITRGVRHNATSQPFSLKITAENITSGPKATSLNVMIGISVAIGIVAIVIAIIVLRIYCSRKQKDQTSRAFTTDNSSVPPPKNPPTNRYDKTKPKPHGEQQVSTSMGSNQPAAQNTDTKLVENELVLFDNDLYGGARCASPNPVVPSAGCIPEENIYNEIHTVK